MGLASAEQSPPLAGANGYRDEKVPRELQLSEEELARHSRTANRKLDLILLPILTAYYFLNFLDRANFGNAKAAGLQGDLGLSNRQYSIALTITYVPYIASEFPLTLTLKKLGPHIVLPALVASWGFVCCMQGFVSSYSGLLVARFFLGLAEGGILPGLVTYMTMFWMRRRLQIRISILFTATSLAGAFSGLLASAILNIQSNNYPSWSFIFFIEGAFTVLFGVTTWPLLSHTLQSCKWLSAEEKAALEHDLAEDGAGEAAEHHVAFSWDQVTRTISSPHIILMFINFFLQGTLLYSLAYFTPSIVASLGHDKIMTQLYSVPPYACAFVFSLTSAWFGDRYQCRGLTTLVAFAVALAGYSIFYGTNTSNAHYAGLFLSIMGAYTFAPAASTWQASNSAPHTAKATAVAVGFVGSNSGGILSSWLYDDPPAYNKGTKVSIIFACLGMATTALVMWHLSDQNRKKAYKRAELQKEGSEMDEKESVRLGDRSPYFDYTL